MLRGRGWRADASAPPPAWRSPSAPNRYRFGAEGEPISSRVGSAAIVAAMSDPLPAISIPADLLPGDGRFGCGPSKVRPEAMDALNAVSSSYMGTSHRQATVRFTVSQLRNGLTEMFALPDGYEIMLGNGGSTTFWDIATFGLIEQRSQHLSFGEFSSKFAAAATAAPHLDDPEIIESAPGTHPEAIAPRGHRRLRAHPQRDLDRCRHEPDPARRRRRRRAGGGRRDLSRRRAPLRPVGRPTSTTSLPRSAWPPTAASGWPRSRHGPSSASSASPPRAAGSPPRSISRSPSTTRARTRPTTPRPWPRSSWPCSRSSG